MKKFLSLLLCACLMAGCSTGGDVSQEEYDAVVAERDELQAELDTLQTGTTASTDRITEYTAKVTEFRTNFEDQYTFCKFAIQMMEKYLSWNMEKEKLNLSDDYNSTTLSLSRFEEYLDDEEALQSMSDDEYESLLKSIDDQYNYWHSQSYETILYAVDYILE